MAKINKMPPMAAPAAQPPMVEDSASGDFSHIDEFIASLSEEERMYAREALSETSEDKEFDEMVGMSQASSVNEEGEMD